MEFDQRSTDRLPFHDPDEAEQAHPGVPASSRDARIGHLERVPLFTGFNEDELRRIVELSRIVESPTGTVITQIGEPGDSFFVIIDGMVAVRAEWLLRIKELEQQREHLAHVVRKSRSRVG